MDYTVIGFKNVDYVNQSGRHITGTRVFLTYEDHLATGLACLDVYLKDSIDYIPVVGDRIALYYNRFGKVEYVRSIAG